uniref:methyl-accepting chemotaxis protein n=1 Tax=Agathobacter sp. TaxID=2021311 RepID=UPI004055AB33
MGNVSKKNFNITIAETIGRTLRKVFMLILGVVILIAVSLFLFTRYTSVVNSAGIVRGGSQRVIKQVIAGADESAALALVESTLSEIGEQMHLGNFPKSRDDVEDYWNKTIKPDIEEFKASGDYAILLEDSETLFKMTNQMVYDAQTLVDILAIILYAILIVFLIVCFFIFRNISVIFNDSVVKPISELEGSLNNLAEGILSENFVYEKQDEIGRLYKILNDMRLGILSYIQDIDKNLKVMADGDLVSGSDMNYLGDYVPIQRNLAHIRNSLSTEFKSMDEQADQVALSAEEVAKVSQSLADGAVSQTDSIQTLQEKIKLTLEENTKVDIFVEEARKSSDGTNQRVEYTRSQMDKAVLAMKDISEASEEIRTIVKALDDITSETSLLSLNASIEAARAGEAGRGFAIVAENVSKLAEESSKSTEIITKLIENALECVLKGTQIVNDAAESLNGIADYTNTVDEIIGKLNEQSKLEHELMEEINTLSINILDVVTDNSAISEECAASSAELITYSGNLKKSVAKFVTG